MIKLYAFLGNYGKEYANHRHNVAWLFLDSLGLARDLRWTRAFKGKTAGLETAGGKIWFLKPETYMNNSGESVAELCRFYRIEPSEVLAVHDELEMAFGCFGFKFSGGLGGHNGLRSIEKHVGTRDFARLRFGIGRPEHPDVAGYVLSDFRREEREVLELAVFPKAGEALSQCLDAGFEAVSEKYKKVCCPQ
ncbi:MAG: aminoacyl-tRNA hydrolase [Spirochaetia bacterium]|jgi:PTH1 family peptidyl-tRNA hydrolase|nr:aminoacyl-tRNA hydrolase [Spirochaetia bacterium]